MRSRWLRALCVLLPLVVLIAIGCSKDEKSTNPDNGGGAMTSEEFIQEMDDVAERATAGLMDCQVGYLIDLEANADLFAFLQSEVLPAVAEGAGIAPYYGTWDDTSSSRSDGIGVVRTALTPANAVRLMLVGTDTLGTPLGGDLTLTSVSVDVDTVNNVYEVSFDAALHEHASNDVAQVALSFQLIGNPEGSGGLEDFTLDLASSGSICDVAYDLNVAAQSGAITISGWYQDQIRVAYQVAITTTESDTTVTATISLGTGTPPRVRVAFTAHPGATEDCLTGTVSVRGHKQADLVATGCGTDEMTVYLVVGADSLTAAEVLGDLWAQIGGFIEGGGAPVMGPVALPFGYNPAAGPTSGLGCRLAWSASAGSRSGPPFEVLPGKPRSRVLLRD
jgi:hypothetical protein